jgi:FAD/FMN-containing dehydrogenase/Fe-S oxidoreductase
MLTTLKLFPRASNVSASPFPILRNTEGLHPHEAFAASRELEALLRQSVRGEVRFDSASRSLYATDASNYRQLPIGLVIPRDESDVEAAIAACRATGAAVLARGAGTSLAGQCTNSAVVLDFSKYMRGIVALDPVDKTARVQPGVVLDRVREAAEQHHLTFAPDPATHNRCTLGGMIGNNSCGVHGLMGGKTVDNVESLDVLLYDGSRMEVGATSEERLASVISAGGRRGEIYAGLKRLRDANADEIRRGFPQIPRRVSGYNLDELLPESGFNVARALVGSEGTCVTVLGATLRLTDSPPFRALVVLGFEDAFIAADAVPSILEHKPIGLEGFDGLLIDYMRRKDLAIDNIALLPRGRGFLLVEFGGWSAEEARDKADRMVARSSDMPQRPDVRVFTDPLESSRIWAVRESALGATVFAPGEPEGWEGWEDAAVPPAKLGSYLRQLFALMSEYDYRSPMYGHFGQGCVHLRINFDLETAAGIAKYREFIDQAADIVLAHGGSLSGEHGDGQARAALLPKMFSPQLMQAFRDFKKLWDPLNCMNPGKLVDPVAVYDPSENLRLGAGYTSRKTETYFSFAEDHGSMAHATLRCVGVGACRKETAGTMCPSYMATREEKHSTRGRAHLLWELLQGKMGAELDWQNESVKEALDLCLSCKACKHECPVNVDLATYKAEFLAHYYEKKARPLYAYAFGFMDRWADLASNTPRLANLAGTTPIVRDALKATLSIAPQREIPRFATHSFQRTMRRLASATGNERKVVLWPDTWNNYFHPEAAHAAYAVLTEAGFHVSVPLAHVCCGRPLYDFGFLAQAKRYLLHVLDVLRNEIADGTPVVVLEPSCATVFREEMTGLLPNNESAARLRSQTFLLGEFLTRRAKDFRPPQKATARYLVHGHCHQKPHMKEDLALLRATGATVDILDSGCCGMAGPFGFEKDKFDISQALAERGLLPAVRAMEKDTLFVTNGFSCREQVWQNTAVRARHLSEILRP